MQSHDTSPSGQLTPATAAASTPPARPFARSLDERTQLVGEGLRTRPLWRAAFYPDSGEATYWAVMDQGDGMGGSADLASGDGDLGAPPVATPDLDRRRENAVRARRRSRGRLRRYVTANTLTFMWTLTCADQTVDRREMVRRCQRFGRRLGVRWPELVYAYVLERHKSGAWHAHWALSRYVSHPIVVNLWGHGFVLVSRRRHQGGRDAARRIAGYLAKYIGKDLGAGLELGQHAYEVRQGFQPRVIRLRSWDRVTLWRGIIAQAGGELPSYQWQSSQSDDWRGPPVGFMAWGSAVKGDPQGGAEREPLTARQPGT